MGIKQYFDNRRQKKVEKICRLYTPAGINEKISKGSYNRIAAHASSLAYAAVNATTAMTGLSKTWCGEHSDKFHVGLFLAQVAALGIGYVAARKTGLFKSAEEQYHKFS